MTAVDRAADFLWAPTSFEAFDLLHTDRGLSVDEVMDVIVTTAEAAIVSGPLLKRWPTRLVPGQRADVGR